SALRNGNSLTIAAGYDNRNSNPAGTYATGGSNNYKTEQEIIAAGASSTTINWLGCIEERATVNTITSSSGTTIPTGAFDLEINTVPTNESTRWRPFLPELIWRRNGTSNATSATHMPSQSDGMYACPSEARRLQAWNRTNLLNYVNGLASVGGTYHDIGMIWGARMISSGGIFADSPDVFGGVPATRHIIYMTDGQLAPNLDSYTAYGVEQSDRRVTTNGNSSTQSANHLQRFRMICQAAKNNNTSVWVIAFATGLSTDMENCASNPDQASTSSNRDELIARFRQIGQQIGALRLVE